MAIRVEPDDYDFSLDDLIEFMEDMPTGWEIEYILPEEIVIPGLIVYCDHGDGSEIQS